MHTHTHTQERGFLHIERLAGDGVYGRSSARNRFASTKSVHVFSLWGCHKYERKSCDGS